MEDKKTVTIRLKPYLQEFYTGISGSTKANSSLRSFLGSIIILFIERIPRDYTPKLYTGEQYFDVELKHYSHHTGPDIRGNVYINEFHFPKIERCLMEYFDSIFFTFMDQWTSNRTYSKSRVSNPKVNDGILVFCRQHKINYARYFECLKKKYYRERNQRMKLKNNSSNTIEEFIPTQVQNYVQLIMKFE